MGLRDVYPSHNSVYKPTVIITAYERNPCVIAPYIMITRELLGQAHGVSSSAPVHGIVWAFWAV